MEPAGAPLDRAGLPAPGALSPAGGDRWHTEDLHALVDGVDHEIDPCPGLRTRR
ncbi:MAG: hypothetical protein WKF76_08270 [Nocardioidaceae bacterium]